ncbi:hypothetical protein Pmani_034858 [Petrolisthes manimaculis]|uniref:Uncharacterized protein n=1 Tax=Petrolisthes manimaculis TaxID=1843537 RepID=A0AAE1NNH8_9EUCA|nr:hypothetical protein Pmani_034858 [Petrolisthes manimaculis]
MRVDEQREGIFVYREEDTTQRFQLLRVGYDLDAPVPLQVALSLPPINGVVRPPVSAPSHRPTRNTNKLHHIELVMLKKLWEYEYSLHLREPINAQLEMNLPE